MQTLVTAFTVAIPDVDEDGLTVEDPWTTARELAWHKARAVAQKFADSLILAGDTVVAYSPNGDRWVQLGKPSGQADAERMLRELSGREHLVITGIALAWPGGAESFAETTRVRFRDLTDAEIGAYAATSEPYDKAGGYAIQGGAAGFVSSVDGSHSNVVGLPLEALESALRRLKLVEFGF